MKSVATAASMSSTVNVITGAQCLDIIKLPLYKFKLNDRQHRN